MKVTVGIPTKARYDALSHCLLSIAFQSKKPHEIIVVDDTDDPIDLREMPIYQYLFRLLDDYGIRWQIIFGKHKGQHWSHQLIQDIATGDFIFRIDDDCVAEPNCLEVLSELMINGIGAVAPLVLMPNPSELPKGLTNTINDLTKPNVQWFNQKSKTIQDAEHLYSCFLYRKGIARFELSLSRKAHREETLFSYSIKRAGYSLLISSAAKVWHWRSMTGGIRSDNNIFDYEHDEKIFQSYLSLWGINSEDKIIVVLDNGIGDHWCFRSVLPKLRSKDKKIIIACCYPDVFCDEPGIELISIAEAKLLLGNIEPFSIYKWCIDNNHKGNLVEAFEKMYL